MAEFDRNSYEIRLGSDKAVENFPAVIRIDSKDGEHGWRIKLTDEGLEITKTSDENRICICPLVSNQIIVG